MNFCWAVRIIVVHSSYNGSRLRGGRGLLWTARAGLGRGFWCRSGFPLFVWVLWLCIFIGTAHRYSGSPRGVLCWCSIPVCSCVVFKLLRCQVASWFSSSGHDETVGSWAVVSRILFLLVIIDIILGGVSFNLCGPPVGGLQFLLSARLIRFVPSTR